MATEVIKKEKKDEVVLGVGRKQSQPPSNVVVPMLGTKAGRSPGLTSNTCASLMTSWHYFLPSHSGGRVLCMPPFCGYSAVHFPAHI